jgi:carbonic anhydrase
MACAVYWLQRRGDDLARRLRHMNKLLEGLDTFQRSVYPRYERTFRDLAARQQPLALFITCSDSRIDPSLLLQCEPGDIFVSRNPGNFIPPYETDRSGVGAAVEYAIEVLDIRHVVVCGHSDCGALKGALNPETVAHCPAIGRWLRNAEAARRIALDHRDRASDIEILRLATHENVIAQLTNLATYPCIAAGLARGAMNLYGWYYDMPEGRVHCFDPATRRFAQFDGTFPTMPEDFRFSGRTNAA